jgi:hypothetical protein
LKNPSVPACCGHLECKERSGSLHGIYEIIETNFYLLMKKIHLIEIMALNEEIRKEWRTGIRQLPPKYSYLFNGSLHQWLDDKIQHKLMWINSLWTARDNEIHISPLCICDSDIVNLYKRWKSKNDITD